MNKQQELENKIKQSMTSLSGMMLIGDLIEKTDRECILLDDDTINYTGLKKITPFLALLSQRRYNTTKYLIDNYPNLNITHIPEDKMYNPLYLALKMDQTSLAKHLIAQGCNINEKIKDGNTIFMQLFDHKPYMSLTEETLIYVLQNFKPDLSITNKYGYNAYEVLVKKCSPHCVRNFTPMLKKAVDDYNQIVQEKKYFEKEILANPKNSIKLKV